MPMEPSMEMKELPATRLFGARVRSLVAVGAAALVLAVVAPPAGAQTPPPGPTTTAPADEELGPPTPEQEQALEDTLALIPADVLPQPDDPFVDVVLAQQAKDDAALAQLAAVQASDQANAESFVAAISLNAAQDKADAATRRRDAARKELSTERDRLADLTVRAYVTGGDIDIEQYRAILEGDTTDPSAGRQILFGQVLERQKLVTEQATRDLSKARRSLNWARKKLGEAQAEAGRKTDTAEDRARRKTEAEVAHVEANQALADANVELRSAITKGFPLVTVDSPIIGLPRLSPEDLAGWFNKGAHNPRVATPIEDYARWFIEEGASEGIRGDIAFAQAVLETGGFTNTDSVVANNFSGIGHCDSCAAGWVFPTPRMGVRAQIQLLKSYAVKKPDYVNELVDKRLRGPAGCCDTWGDLTTVWATDPTYGPKVMLMYSSILEFALQRRAAGEGFAPTT
jgi:hypothetical protein